MIQGFYKLKIKLLGTIGMQLIPPCYMVHEWSFHSRPRAIEHGVTKNKSGDE